MAYGFKCPQCGGFKWGTLDCGKPKQEWIGTCNGDRDYPGCGFRWHRATEDEKIIGIPFSVSDKTPNAEFSGTPAALSPEAPLERRVGGAVPPAPTFGKGE